MPHEILLRERYGTQTRDVVYVKPPDQNKVLRLGSVLSAQKSVWDWTKDIFWTIFLPQGYPNSVSDDYVDYQIWDTVQAFCSSLNGALTTQAIMKGVGVGDTAATPLAATLTWLMKDGTGMMGRILFAWWKGSFLDSDCKKWRLFADFLNDAAMALELIAPHTGHFAKILAVSTIAKSVVGVAGGATRAAVTQHQARRNNMADVSAKDGSQETLVNLSALVISLFFLPIITKDQLYVWHTFTLLVGLHLFANYKAVRALKIESLNRSRFILLLKTYLTTQGVLPPKHTNIQESVILGRGLNEVDLCGFEINLGGSIQNVLQQGKITAEDLKLLLNIYKGKPYLLLLNMKRRQISVIIHEMATSKDQIEAYFHALLLGIATCCITHKPLTLLRPGNTSTNSWSSPLSRLQESTEKFAVNPSLGMRLPLEAMMATSEIASLEFVQFVTTLKKQGWNTECHQLQADEWRGDWHLNNLK